MSIKKRMNSGSESPGEIITQQFITKICKMAEFSEICVDALWFKEPGCNCNKVHDEVSIPVKFAIHQVLLLYFDSIDGKTPGLWKKVQEWKKGHRNEWVDLCEIEKKMIQNTIAFMPMSDDRKKSL